MLRIFLEYLEVMMSRQILLCVETNSKARTDYQYINETIHRFYVNDKDKVNEVKRFKSKKMIEAVLPQNLSQNEYKINGSNILNVLDKFWTRKN